MAEVLPMYLLVFIRIMSFLVTVPIFSYRNIPTSFKIGLGFFLAILVGASLSNTPVTIINEQFLLFAIREVIIGLMIGFIAAMIFYAMQVAGGFIDLQMGFALANVIDPQTGIQTPITGRYLYIFAMMLLLAVDGHHMLIRGIMHSFELVPLQTFQLLDSSDTISHFVLVSFKDMFFIAFQMAFPIVACLFLVDLALGLVARTVPQVNVFVIGLPLKILVSFIVILMTLSVTFFIIQKILFEMFDAMETLMKIIGGT